MARGPLFDSDYRPLFSGHETFPLRYGWLKKAYDAVVAAGAKPNIKTIFLAEDSIAHFGVGKNMVRSIRHWATACGILDESGKGGKIRATALGDFLFGPNGVDPYLEQMASLWFVHWTLCSIKEKTTWYWTFNHFMGSTFRRDDLVEGLVKLAEEHGWPKASRTTIQRDVECLVRTYESGPISPRDTIEDTLESPLSELGLVRGWKGSFQLVRGLKPSLPDGVFAVALDSFWKELGSRQTLSFETIGHEPGSPGRVFLLDETDLTVRLSNLEEITRGLYRWSETAGLKQVIRERPFETKERMGILRLAYPRHARREAA